MASPARQRPPSRRPTDPSARRVIRGGSWNNDPDNARAAYRNDNHPTNRNDNLGFRLVLAPRPAVARNRERVGLQ